MNTEFETYEQHKSDAMTYESKASTPRKPFAAVGSLSAADLYAAARAFNRLPKSVRNFLAHQLAFREADYLRSREIPRCHARFDALAAECRALLDALNGGA